MEERLPEVPRIMGVMALRQNLPRVIREIEEGPVVVTQRGTPKAVLLSLAAYQTLRERLAPYGVTTTGSSPVPD
jgi:prevent-host-death family protein